MRVFLFLFVLLSFLYRPLIYSENNVVTLIESYEQGHGLTEHELHSGFSAPASIDLEAGFNIFTEGSCIYWKAFETGLDLGFTTGEYKDYDIKTDYHLGFKAKTGFHTTGDYWNFAFSYLFLHTQGDTKPLYGNITTSHPSNQFWFKDDVFLVADSLKARWKLHVDMMDALLSRPFYLGCKVTMEPYTALRGGWIMQKYKVPAFVSSVNGQLKNSTKSRSHLIGPRAGLITNWIIANHFRMFGDVSASLLYQKFKITNFQEILLENVIITNIDIKKKLTQVTPNIDACLGVGAGNYFFHKRLHLDLSFSYDFSIYFNQNSLTYIKNLVNDEKSSDLCNNLTLHGVTGTLRIDF